MVGQILHQNKNPETIPCHRVVFSDGSLSNAYAFGGLAAQRKKLRNEGIVFLPNRRVDMRCCFYSLKSFSSFLSDTTSEAGI